MSYPKTYRAIRRTAKPYPLTIEITNETLPKSLGPNDVVIRIHAASLNYRDVAMLHEGKYPAPVIDHGIEGSCCAAEIVAKGSAVEKFTIGDRVTVTTNLNLLTGDERDAEFQALGGDVPGVLREYAVFEEKHLVLLPSHLSWEEAATLPGVGITAWLSLNELNGLPAGATALLQGTGGVSIMSLLVCLAAGIRPIITSSSDEKLARLRSISPDIVALNYRSIPDIAAEVIRLTDGKGVDYVLNNVGLSSIPTDLQILRRYGGSIAFIGFLEGFSAEWDPSILMTLISKAAKIRQVPSAACVLRRLIVYTRGILAGSRSDLEAVSRFIGEKKVDLKPLVDRVFSFDDAKAAFEYLGSGSHVGKVVIKM